MLSNVGKFHIYDFEDRVIELKNDLESLGYSNIIPHGNTRKKFDGYYWELTKLAIKLVKEKEKEGIYDFVYFHLINKVIKKKKFN